MPESKREPIWQRDEVLGNQFGIIPLHGLRGDQPSDRAFGCSNGTLVIVRKGFVFCLHYTE